MSYLKVGEPVIPELASYIENPEEVVGELLRWELAAVKARLAQGVSSTGRPLPSLKTTSTPLHSSGQLAASIAIEKRGSWAKGGKGGDLPFGFVGPTGRRTEERIRLAAKGRRDRARETREHLTAVGGFTPAEIRRGVAQARGRRIADTNQAVAAILNAPPKDKRAKAGGRPALKVFQATAAEQGALELIASRLIRVVLVDRRSGDRFIQDAPIFRW